MSECSRELNPVEARKRDALKLAKPRVYEKVMHFADRIKRGESIAILQFQYDYRCNFRCRHCCISKMEPRERSFTIPDIRELSRQADEMGLAHWVITGGEPLTFPDFDQIVEAIDPAKFFISSDTNGWLLDKKRAKHLKSIGLDKIQLSLDSLNPEEHDAFRRARGSHERAVRAIDAAQEAGLNIIIATVVTKQRIRSQEFIDFLEFAKEKDVPTFITFAKPVGSWQGNLDVLVDEDDHAYEKELQKKYNVFTHMTPAYGMDLGCIAVKRMVSITKYGDIMPCPYIHISLGNFFEEPLKDIIERGMKIKPFTRYTDTCLIAIDRKFINTYEKKLDGKPLPVPWREVFSPEDFE
ncbi:MAG: radical SAM protein [Syntrophobacteraceae bacterium]|jgi:MoaA/NifB/PqqE/SkfB family radical SAM enzyme